MESRSSAMMMTTTTTIDRRSDAPGSFGALTARHASAGLATLIAMADTDDVSGCGCFERSGISRTGGLIGL
jgi:hypothetical protein